MTSTLTDSAPTAQDLARPAPTPGAVLTVENLTVRVTGERRTLELVSDVSFAVVPGQILALVGESGCGKSLTCLSLARLNPEPPFSYAGRILLGDCDVLQLGQLALRQMRGRAIAYIFQEPATALNPVRTVGSQIAEAIRLHDPEEANVTARVCALLRQVGIPEPEQRAKAYPHQLSGGMQQRIMIAMALSCRPSVLVADEPTTALDVTIQAQILELLQNVCRDSGTAIILVTHNLGIVAGVADAVGVMYAGQLVEYGPTKAVLKRPAHPYTKALLAAVPRLGQQQDKLQTIPGRVPPPTDYAPGCRFAGRCPIGLPDCGERRPDSREIEPTHAVCCWRAG